nr:hypothetical protein [uncultured Flavobacterium sp.]
MVDQPENIVNLGEEEEPINFSSARIEDSIFAKNNVSEYDIFILAKRILAFSTSIFVGLALLRMFVPIWYKGETTETLSGIVEVWDFSKVAINSIISLVLGLYFGAKTKT